MRNHLLVFSFLLLSPNLARAVDGDDDFAGLVSEFLGILQALVPFIFAVTLIVVIWKIIDTWIINAGDTVKIAAGKQFILKAVLVLVVMSSIWGILALLRSSLF